ncbi:MAG: type II secretion system protein M [Betaproteobacteria bacterium]|nr:type II secretion system protein M [Betaproteobacteria bacterium]
MKQWWIGLSRRERIATSVAAALVALALIFLVGIEPAWRTRVKLGADLPRLRAQAAELDQLAAEAKKLKLHTRTLESPEQTRASLSRFLGEKGVSGAQIREEGDHVIVSAKRIDAAAWLAWLKDTTNELPLRIAAARMSKVGTGTVDAEVTFAPAGQK